MTLRDGVKNLVEVAASSLGLVRVAARANRTAVAVLAYHNVVPAGQKPEGDLSLHMPEARFRRQLDAIQERHRIVSLDTLGEEGAADVAPRVAITFDDAYVGAVLTALPELARRGLPCTVFISAGMMGRHSFWWDRLAGEDGVVPPGARDHALWRLGGDDEEVRAWMSSEGLKERDLPDHARSATRGELAEAVASGLVTIAAHGWGHRNFAAAGDEHLDRELQRPAESLSSDFEAYRPWLAYPYGLHTDRVESAAAATYDLAFRVEGGLLRPGDVRGRARTLPRINVPAGMSPRGLALRLAGVAA